MKKRISLGVTIALMAVTATLTMSLTYQFSMDRFTQQVQNLNERQKMYSKLSQIDQKVRDSFLSAIDETQLGDAIANGYVEGIGDQHSYYLTQAECSSRKLELSGRMVGIGIDVVLQDDGTIAVTRVTPNSPAAVAGMKKGDVLAAAGGSELSASDFNGLSQIIGGEAGTDVTLTVRRGEEELQITATRRQFEMVTVESRLLGNGIGYLRITEFNDNTDEEFSTALQSLKAQGATGLVIDVRNNPGGSLEAVANILDQLLPAGNIVSSSGKDGKKTVLYTSDSAQLDLPLVVLVNGNSASASELLACAVQDFGKGKIVGTQTYGKGTMQQLFELTDGSAVNLTVAKFYPPVSGNFDGVGVTPDIVASLSEEAQARFYFLTDEEDTQLSTAVSALIIGGAETGADGASSAQSSDTAPDDSDAEPASSEGAGSDLQAVADAARVTLRL